MLKSAPILLLLLGLSLISARPGSPRTTVLPPNGTQVEKGEPETVDFGRPPPAGLAFRLREMGTYRVTGKLDFGEAWLRTITLDVKQRLCLVQRIEAADGTRVRRLTRHYEAHDLEMKQVSADPKDPEAEPKTTSGNRRHPLAGRRVRASWAEDGKGPTLEEGDDGAWQAASSEVSSRLTENKLLQPVFPLPAGPKRVGDRWILRDEALAPYFSDTYSEQDPSPKIEGTAEIVFTGFIDHATGRCAALALTFDVKAGYPNLPSHHMQMKGTCLYHLQHRIVVSLQAAGRMAARGDIRQKEHSGQLDLSGTIRSQSVVEILPAPAKKQDGGGEER